MGRSPITMASHRHMRSLTSAGDLQAQTAPKPIALRTEPPRDSGLHRSPGHQGDGVKAMHSVGALGLHVQPS